MKYLEISRENARQIRNKRANGTTPQNESCEILIAFAEVGLIHRRSFLWLSGLG